MPNVKGGKNYKKGKKGKGKLGRREETPYADSAGLMYAQCMRKLGGDRVEVTCNDDQLRQAIIPGSFYKRVWINMNDILLVQINEMKTTECFILYKYTPHEAHHLKTQGELRFEVSGLSADTNDVIFGDDGLDSSDDENIHDEVEKINKLASSKPEPKKPITIPEPEVEYEFNIDDI